VICRKSKKNPKYTQDGNRELITVLECVSTEGMVLPLLVVTKEANYYIGTHIRDQRGPKWVYGHSPKGWTSNEIRLGWLEDAFESI
jgi:hypothetical protein